MKASNYLGSVRVWGLIVVLGLTILSSESSALLRKGQLGFTGSIVSGFPSSNFADLTNTGLGVGIELEYFMSNSLSGGLIFNYLPFQGPDLIAETTLSEEWAVITYGLMAKYHFDPEKEIVPYFKLGGLVTNYSADVSRLYEDPADSFDAPIDTTLEGFGKLTVTGGVGIRWDINSWVGISGELLFTKFYDVVHEIHQFKQGQQGQKIEVVTRRKVDAQYFNFNLNATFFIGGKKEQ